MHIDSTGSLESLQMDGIIDTIPAGFSAVRRSLWNVIIESSFTIYYG